MDVMTEHRIRSTTDEMLAARFDKEPWVSGHPINGPYTRHSQSGPGRRFAPRPEFIPSRFTTRALGQLWEAPRPEPNPILVAMRRPHWVYSVNPAEWLAALDDQPLPDGTEHCWHHVQIVESGATPAQIEDARKVLTRFVNVYNESVPGAPASGTTTARSGEPNRKERF